jgi:hypothetical protein
MRIDPHTRLSRRKLGGQLEQLSPVAAALQVIAHSDTPEHSDVAMDIDPNDADGHSAVPQNERVVIRPMVIGMVGVVRGSAPAKLEQHSPANRVIRYPIGWRV